jgi:hypothetical protein
MTDIRANNRILLAFVAAFILNKVVLRPYVISNDITGLIETFAFSFPNLCEAVVGTLMLTNIALVLNSHFLANSQRFKERTIYFTVTTFSAVYVILQEFKVHNIGGRNVYDSNDVVFSVVGLGLVIGYLLIKKPKYTVENVE